MTVRHSTPTTGADQYTLGSLGEASVAAWYKDLGYQILNQRYRTRDGEVDIIAQASDGTVVFAEVKTRRGTQFGAAESVTARKLGTMRKVAAAWLRDQQATAVRFDVVEVLVAGRDVISRMYQGVNDGAC